MTCTCLPNHAMAWPLLSRSGCHSRGRGSNGIQRIQGSFCIPDKEAFSVANHSLGGRTKSEPTFLTGSPRVLV